MTKCESCGFDKDEVQTKIDKLHEQVTIMGKLTEALDITTGLLLKYRDAIKGDK